MRRKMRSVQLRASDNVLQKVNDVPVRASDKLPERTSQLPYVLPQQLTAAMTPAWAGKMLVMYRVGSRHSLICLGLLVARSLATGGWF